MAADQGNDQPPAALSLEAATAVDLTWEFKPVCGGCYSSRLRVNTLFGRLPRKRIGVSMTKKERRYLATSHIRQTPDQLLLRPLLVGVRDLVAHGYFIPGGETHRGAGSGPFVPFRMLSDLESGESPMMPPRDVCDASSRWVVLTLVR